MYTTDDVKKMLAGADIFKHLGKNSHSSISAQYRKIKIILHLGISVPFSLHLMRRVRFVTKRIAKDFEVWYNNYVSIQKSHPRDPSL